VIEPATARALIDHLRPRRDAMVESLGEIVRHESPTHDKPALDALADRLTDRFAPLGAVERLADPREGDHLRVAADVDSTAPGAPPTLVLGHFDTVWGAGTLATMPFRVESGRAHGPGAYDMKAGLVIAEFAIAAIRDLGLRPPRPVVLLWTSDEEDGSPSSRAIIEAEARQSAVALVLEPPIRGGALKTARKGVGRYTIKVKGRKAHAGVEPEKGVNALIELARQILAVGSLASPVEGTTLTVTRARAGKQLNVVPAFAKATFDVRVATMAEARRVEAELLGLSAVDPGARLAVTGGLNRPPMERTPAVAALFARARALGAAIGLDLAEGATGGGSDGNFAAAVGTPTLDGLGADGDGAHAAHEHVLVDSLPERAALLAALLLGLESP